MNPKTSKPVASNDFTRAPNLARMQQRLWDEKGKPELACSPAIKEINSINLRRKK